MGFIGEICEYSIELNSQTSTLVHIIVTY